MVHPQLGRRRLLPPRQTRDGSKPGTDGARSLGYGWRRMVVGGVYSVKGAFWKLCNDCRFKASPHVLPHTAATWLVIDGVPLREVARLLGNSEAMVGQVYGKHSPDYLRRAVNALSLSKSPTLTPN